jgi:RHS repeat-associated protein
MTRSDTRLLALPGTSKKVATHPVAQLSNEDIPVANLLQGTHRPLPPRTHTFHTSYDAAGKRVKKYVPSTGETTVFVYDAAGKLIEEYSTIVAATNDAKVAYLTNDHLGSPRINTDANGNVTARHDYHPFGEEIATSQRTTGLVYSGDSIRKQFTGYERDGETELDFAEARYVNVGFGRFSSPDNVGNDTSTTDPQRWNLYLYVRNNPLRFVDPGGKDLALNFQGSTYKVERYNGTLRIVDGAGNVAETAQLVAAAKMLNDLDIRGGLNNEINTLIESGSHVMDLGFVSGSDSPTGGTRPSETDPQYSRSGVSLNTSTEEMVGESTIVLGTEISSAAYLAKENDLNAAHAYGRVKSGKEKGTVLNQFNNDPNSPLPGSTTYEEFRAQSSSDLRRTMGIAPERAILPPRARPAGSGSGEIDNPEPDLGPAPPPPARRQQPSENNTPIQRRSKQP